MATITLPCFTFGSALGMGAFEGIGTAFTGAKNSSSGLSGALGALKSKIELAAVAAKVETSQEQAKKAEERESTKKSSLSIAYEKLNTLISDTGSVDLKASSKIRERKDAFYERYNYLKPECEKTKKEKRREKRAERWQNFKDFCGGVAEAIKNIAISVVEWCKEHWESIVLILAAVAFIVIIGVAASLTGGALGVILAAAFKGAIIGAVAGGIGNATATALEYYSKNGTLKGASGAIFDSVAFGIVSGTITGAATGAISGMTHAIGTAMHMKKIGNIALHCISGSIKSASSSSINYFLNNGTMKGAADEVAWSAFTGFVLGIKGGFSAKYGYRGNQILYYKGIECDQYIAKNLDAVIISTELFKSSFKKAAKTYAKDKWNINLAFNWEDVVTNFLFEPSPVY